jgi:hypothetical protein
MKTRLLATTALSLGAAALSGSAFAANPDSDTATATANVVVPISITKTSDLDFGRFAAGTAGGTVRVDNSGARLAATGGVILTAAGSTPTAAVFDVTGDNNATYSIDAATGTDTALDDGNSHTMALALTGNLTGAANTAAIPATGTLDGTGAQSIHIGGTLTVGATQAPGTYTGTITVTVDYN